MVYPYVKLPSGIIQFVKCLKNRSLSCLIRKATPQHIMHMSGQLLIMASMLGGTWRSRRWVKLLKQDLPYHIKPTFSSASWQLCCCFVTEIFLQCLSIKGFQLGPWRGKKQEEEQLTSLQLFLTPSTSPGLYWRNFYGKSLKEARDVLCVRHVSFPVPGAILVFLISITYNRTEKHIHAFNSEKPLPVRAENSPNQQHDSELIMWLSSFIQSKSFLTGLIEIVSR